MVRFRKNKTFPAIVAIGWRSPIAVVTTDLTQRDFTVLENGVPQPIRYSQLKD